jgi:hypothetical protein
MSITASVCVFCGSRSGHDPAIAEEARRLGELIAANGWRLVYGAGDVGIMGVVASAAQAAGGQTLGVIPVHLMKLERTRGDRAGLVVTETMHERKKVMFMNSDAIVVLPGGAGTLDEFFEILTWRQLHLHGKPIFLLDTGGFWSPLIALLDHVIAQGFADPSLKDYVGVAPSAVALEAELRAALP